MINDMSKILFSIITPCYRGTTTLKRTYDSLLAQCGVGLNFEWILVDDYSNDDNQTVSLIKELCRVAPFPTKTIFLDKNYLGSKSTFLGANIAEGEYVLILDQDDMLTKDALQVFKNLIERYCTVQNVVGVCGRCIDTKGQFIGTKMKWDEIISNELEIRHIHKIRGEMWQCTKREVIQKYFSDFVPGDVNGYAWTRIARKFQYVYTNKTVRLYDTSNPLSLSNAGKIKYLDVQVDMLRYYLVHNHDYLRHDWLMLMKYLRQYIRFTSHMGISVKLAISTLPMEQRYLAFIVAPLGRLRAAVDRKLRRV